MKTAAVRTARAIQNADVEAKDLALARVQRVAWTGAAQSSEDVLQNPSFETSQFNGHRLGSAWFSKGELDRRQLGPEFRDVVRLPKAPFLFQRFEFGNVTLHHLFYFLRMYTMLGQVFDRLIIPEQLSNAHEPSLPQQPPPVKIRVRTHSATPGADLLQKC